MSSGSYSSSHLDKPFWLRPPWAVLFDLIRLHRVRPWDVNLSFLLTSLISEMKKDGHMDFTASGIALLSSATIYRMKSELILKLQDPPSPPEKIVEFIPPSIQLPFRYEYTTTTVDSLVNALEEVLKNEDLVELQSELIPITPAPPVVQEIDDFMVDIDNKIENIYQTLSMIGDEVISFSKLITGLKRLEAIRVFILILFLASMGRIQLWQEEGLNEVYISINRGEADDSETESKIRGQ